MPLSIFRRRLVVVAVRALLGSSIACAAGLVTAETFPTKPITFVVPFGAGSGTDLIARAFGQVLSTKFGVPVIIENRGGANGVIAAQQVARAPADGYTLLLTSNTTQVGNPWLLKKTSYDPEADFAPVTALAKGSLIAVVPAESPMRSIRDLIAEARKSPSKVSFGWGSSSSRVAGEQFKQMTQTDMLNVPYKSNPLAITDLIGGQVTVVFTDTPAGLPLLQGGKLRALGYTGNKRATALPSVPTIEEQGVKGYELSYWNAVYAPRGTPAPIVQKLNEAFVSAAQAPTVKSVYEKSVLDVFTTTPEGLAAFQKSEKEKWGRIIKAAGIEPE
jgi:tripartite-type tricarboxylate transporter receptor subunit TctC